MVVVVDAGADGSIVFIPLLSINFSVAVPVVEVSQKLHEHLVFSHLASLYFGMHRCVVSASQVVGVDVSVSVFVEL